MELTQEPKLKTPKRSVVNHIKTLTSLRGIAALCIVARHFLIMLEFAEPEYDFQPQFVVMILTSFIGYIFCGELFCSGFTQIQLYYSLFGFSVLTIIFSAFAYYAVELKARKYILRKLL